MGLMKLVTPASHHLAALDEFKAEFINNGEKIPGSNMLHRIPNLAAWLAYIDSYEDQEKQGFVPSDTFLVVHESDIIGIVNIRLYLNKTLAETGGHIGYSIRPSQRKKGFGKQMLALAIEHGFKRKLNPILVTCNKDNIASKQTILANKGVYIDSFIEPSGNEVLRYHIYKED